MHDACTTLVGRLSAMVAPSSEHCAFHSVSASLLLLLNLGIALSRSLSSHLLRFPHLPHCPQPTAHSPHSLSPSTPSTPSTQLVQTRYYKGRLSIASGSPCSNQPTASQIPHASFISARHRARYCSLRQRGGAVSLQRASMCNSELQGPCLFLFAAWPSR
jgi:hypothetical protein